MIALPRRAGHPFAMGLICENLDPNEAMLEKNKKIGASEVNIMGKILTEKSSQDNNLSRSVIVDNCRGMENNEKKDIKMKSNMPKDYSSIDINSSCNSTSERNGDIKNEAMLEKNKEIAASVVNIMGKILTEKSSHDNNLSCSVIVDNCRGMENNEKKDIKMKSNMPKDYSSIDINSSCNSTSERNGDINRAMKDPNINDLNQKFRNMTMHEDYLKKTYTTDRLSAFLSYLKKCQAELHILKKKEEGSTTHIDVNETELIPRGPARTKDKNRLNPYDHLERPQLYRTPSLTLTTNVGNRGDVYVRNDQSSVEVVAVQEQDHDFYRYLSELFGIKDVDEVLRNKEELDVIVNFFESMLLKEAGETKYNTANIEFQNLNIQCGAQMNNSNGPTLPTSHQSFTAVSPQHGDIANIESQNLNIQYGTQLNINGQCNSQCVNVLSPQHNDTIVGSMVSVNPLGNNSSQHNVTNSSSISINQEAIINSRPQFTKFMGALSLHCETPSFNNHSSLGINGIAQSPSYQKSPQQQSNIATTSVLCPSPPQRNPYSSQKSPSSPQFTPHNSDPKVSPNPNFSPYSSPHTQTSSTSPYQSEQCDSSYETGSPSSVSAVTSPGSPYLRCSSSSESEQELFVEPSSYNKSIIPFGEPIHCTTESAEQRLNRLSKSTNGEKQYKVEIVRIVLASINDPKDCVRGFGESLMKQINTQVDERKKESWLLSVFLHLQYLKADCRVNSHKSVLLWKNEQEETLLYIAAIKQKCGLTARCIAEIMKQVGFNPAQQVDTEGNSIIHKLACEGDSHVSVLAELLAAWDVQNGKKLFDAQSTNKKGQSLLHLAASSPKPKNSTINLLVNTFGVNRKLQDKYGKVALQYFLKAKGDSKWQHKDLYLAKRLLPPLPSESLSILERLKSDPSAPPAVILTLLEGVKSELKRR